MKPRYFGSFVITCLMLIPGFVSAAPSSWSHSVDIEVNKKGPQVVNVPYEMLDVAQPDRADLRILSPGDRMVPYRLESDQPAEPEYVTLKSYEKHRSDTRTILQGVTGTEGSINGLKFQVSRQRFLKQVTIQGSQTMEDWTTLANNQPIFNSPEGPENMLVEFPARKWKYLRIVIDHRNSSPVNVTGIDLRKPASGRARTRWMNLDINERSRPGQQSVVDVTFPYNHLPVLNLDVRFQEQGYRRTVRLESTHSEKGVTEKRTLAEGVLYQFTPSDGTLRSRHRLPVHRQINTRSGRLIIENLDHPPLTVESVRAQVPRIRVVFWAHRKG
ncbi:MAG: DUF3999 family protein, partial [bacterium]